ncbi:hypothetical protein ACAW74_25015 [Fibrella sp. WM1]|uniref:hypothetical protein n=1 Tax=Fibrella musci TaxID=3242485 RepID=UPI003520D375
MLTINQVSQNITSQTVSTQWAMSSTRFSTNWQVTATLLMDDLDNELEYNSTFGPVPSKPVAPAVPSFFAMLEAEGKTEEAVSFLD